MTEGKTLPRMRSGDVKKLIKALEKECGSLRKAADKIGVKHQNLMNWRDGSNDKFVASLERIRQVLGVTDAEFWEMVKGKK